MKCGAWPLTFNESLTMSDSVITKMDGKMPLEIRLLPWIAALAGRVGNFRKDLLAADSWPAAARVGVELDRALASLEVPPAVPALVVMLGGTGVGKSELFGATPASLF